MTDTLQPPRREEALPPRPSTQTLWFEVITVLAVCILPFLYGCALWLLAHDNQPAPTFSEQAISTIIQCIGQIALVLYLVHASGEPHDRFGLTRYAPARDSMLTIAVLLAGLVVTYVGWLALYALAGQDVYDSVARHDLSALARPAGRADTPLLLIMCVLNGIREELLVRAYLITRLEQLLGSTAWAFSATVLLFAAYHTYQGPAGVYGGLLFAIVYGGAFVYLRRLWPIALAHALHDLLAISLAAR